jgi:hypothetical protein
MRRASGVAALILVMSALPFMEGSALAASYSVSGRVLDNGIGASGAAVTVYAMPSEEVLKAIPTGEAWPMEEVGNTTTDDSGNWSLSFDARVLPRKFRTATGQVDLVAKTVVGSLMSESFLSVVPDQSSSNDRMAAIDVRKTGMRLGTRGARLAAPVPCISRWTDNYYGPFQTKIMDVLAEGSVNGQGSYFYNSTTSTTLGLAFKINSGGWQEASGTLSSSSGSSSGAGFQTGGIKDKRLYSQWRYRGWLENCPGAQKETAKPWTYYARGNTVDVGHPLYSYCSGNYFNGDQYRRINGTNQTYSAGLSFLGILSLSSQAGYSGTAHLYYNFNARGNVCGSNSNGELAPVVEASTF